MTVTVTVTVPEHELRYTPALVQRAVRRFVSWRLVAWDRRLLLAEAVLLACATILARGGTIGPAALLAAIAAGPFMLALVGWAAHRAFKLRALRRMGAPTTTLTVEPDALRFRSGAGEAVLPFEAVMAWREWPDLWLLLTGPNRFIVLPTAGLPAALLAALRARLEALADGR